MPLDVENVFVHGVEGPKKWLVQIESTMERVLGTNVRGALVFATVFLHLVPSYAQMGLFLSEPSLGLNVKKQLQTQEHLSH